LSIESDSDEIRKMSRKIDGFYEPDILKTPVGVPPDSNSQQSPKCRTKPVLQNEKIIGMRVSFRGRDDHLLQKLGFENGDIVLRVNDERIDGPNSLEKIYDLFGSGCNLKLEIERNGERQLISLDSHEVKMIKESLDP